MPLPFQGNGIELENPDSKGLMLSSICIVPILRFLFGKSLIQCHCPFRGWRNAVNAPRAMPSAIESMPFRHLCVLGRDAN